MTNKDVLLNLRLTPELKEEFMEYCKDNALNSSEIIRRLLRKWLDEQKTQ